MNNQLAFHEIHFTVIPHDGQPWLTSTQIAQALGYSSEKSISNLYRRNADEFSPSMTLVINSVTKGFGNGSSEKEVRIFSLRGAHLIAMFSRTALAKEFRRWVLDILDSHTGQPAAPQPPIDPLNDIPFPAPRQFTDEELVLLSYLWLWFERSRMACNTAYPALIALNSPLAGRFGDIAKETRFISSECRAMLARESERITSNSLPVRHASEVLATLRGESDFLLRH